MLGLFAAAAYGLAVSPYGYAIAAGSGEPDRLRVPLITPVIALSVPALGEEVGFRWGS